MSISLENALEHIRSGIAPLVPQKMSAATALGLISAEALFAEISQPPFPRSPYDGYALRAEDSAGASEENPVYLNVVGKSYAGEPAGVTVGAGETVRIMTGGAIPEGADCVIMQERTDEGEKVVAIRQSLRPYENYCEMGEDFKAGELLIPAGARITAAAQAVAAGAGITEITACPRPMTAVLCTGSELASPGQKLASGQIYSSNNALLIARLTELGVWSRDLGRVADELGAMTNAIESASQLSDFVITTGGVSVGEKDLVVEALKALDAEIVFKGVDMKPGMPAVFAVLHGKPLLALSGNPFAAAVSFELLARPILAQLSRDKGLLPQEGTAVLAGEYTKRRPCRRFVRATLENGRVTVPSEQGNGQLRSMIGTNCLAELPAGEGEIAAGTSVNIFMLEGSYYAVQSL